MKANTTGDLERDLQTVLVRYMSQLNARVISGRASQALQTPQGSTEKITGMVRSAARLFVEDARIAELMTCVERVLQSGGEVVRRELTILNEEDVRVARLIAKEICERGGATSLTVQRVATAVSEVARNIVSYTPGGKLEFTLLALSPPRVKVLAEDYGTGIPHLTEVLAGSYRSKTGLGKGLAGLKRLMDAVEIQTGPHGTRITFEAVLK